MIGKINSDILVGIVAVFAIVSILIINGTVSINIFQGKDHSQDVVGKTYYNHCPGVCRWKFSACENYKETNIGHVDCGTKWCCVNGDTLPVLKSPPTDELPKYSAEVYMIDPGLTPNLQKIILKKLDGSGYLRGKYVYVVVPCYAKPGTSTCVSPPGNPVYSENNTFVYKPVLYGQTNYFESTYEGQHFDEVTLYYGFNMAAQYFDNILNVQTIRPIKVIAFDKSIPSNRIETTFGNNLEPVIKYPFNQADKSSENGKYASNRAIKSMIHETTHAVFLSNVDAIIREKIEHETSSSPIHIVNEGYSRYFPASFYGTPIYYTVVPIYQYDLTNNLQYTPSGDYDNNVLAFAGALWQLRQEIGKNVLDPLIVQSWKIIPLQDSRDSVVDTMVALVEADRQMNNGVHGQIIKDHFRDHGIICSNCFNE